MKTSIIILSHNQLDYTKQCIDSIRENTILDYEIIIVDNGSNHETVKFLRELSGIKVVFNNENYGYAKGNNLGYKLATGDIIVFMNNDIVVTSGWLEPMIETLCSDERVGLVGPVTNNISGFQRIPVVYDQITLEGLSEFSFTHKKNNLGKRKKVLRLVGFALACRKELLDEIGAFDEAFGIGNYEDDDLCLRALEKGYSLYIVKDSFVHHFGSATFKNSEIDYASLMIKNQEILHNKWGFNVNYFMFSRPEVVNLVPKGVKRVLEIGCGMGAMAIDLKEMNNCEVVGIEVDKPVAQFAKFNLNHVYSEDIESFNVSELGKFDCIICADVLEHLKDPWVVVKNLVSQLAHGGCMIVSIPNAANIEVIKSLLQGDFTYKDAGILDRTHLRFFTRKTLTTLFPENMKIRELHSITLNYNETEKMFIELLGRLGEKFGIDTEMLEVDALTYQFLLKIEKMDDC